MMMMMMMMMKLFAASVTQHFHVVTTFSCCHDQGTLQRPFCLANSLSIVLKVLFENKMTTSSHKQCIITSKYQLLLTHYGFGLVCK